MTDKKDAVTIGVTLSGQIITASLAMIAVVGTFAAFVIDKREVGPIYYLVTGVAFFSFVTSIFWGGKGIDKARKEGHAGIWEITSTKKEFDNQSKFALLGILFFSCSVFLGREKSDDTQKKINKQELALDNLTAKVSATQKRVDTIQYRLDSAIRVFSDFTSANSKIHCDSSSVH
jgi:hypothetical protein